MADADPSHPLSTVTIDPYLLKLSPLIESLREATRITADPDDRTPDAWRFALAHVAALPLTSAAREALAIAMEHLTELLEASAAMEAAGLALADQLEAMDITGDAN